MRGGLLRAIIMGLNAGGLMFDCLLRYLNASRLTRLMISFEIFLKLSSRQCNVPYYYDKKEMSVRDSGSFRVGAKNSSVSRQKLPEIAYKTRIVGCPKQD